ncbi:MAG TPA: transglycosylase family protein [Streptomyces sp.]
MGSANGRHRRPRQAPAIIVAAGVTGSAIAIPLLGAAGAAHAADASTWDRVAECESGGMWSADLGNGFYGGLQFSQDTWSAYGGKTYAERADLASRAQQIAVAEKVLADQGPQAWPSCSVISGLAVDGTLPGVDPGSAPAVPSATQTPSGNASGSASGSATDHSSPAASNAADNSFNGNDGGAQSNAATGGDTGATGSAPSTTPSSDASQAPGASEGEDGTAGKHRGTAASEAGAKGADNARDAGRHASRGDSEARDAGATTDGTYTVRKGDNLSAIADAQDVPGGWPALYEANKAEVGSNPDLILPGQDLDLGQADTGSAADSAAGNAAASNAASSAASTAGSAAGN